MTTETEPTGQELKDRILDSLYKNNTDWINDALVIIADLQPGLKLLGEGIGNIVREKIGPPLHHNVWGSLIRVARKQKLIVPTGKYCAALKPTTHAHMYPEYIIPF